MRKEIVAVWFSLPVFLGISTGASGDSWTCDKADLTRQLIIVYPEAPKTLPCGVFYIKPDENVLPRALWEASHTEGYCEEKAAEFVSKLESWRWRCMRDETEQASGSSLSTKRQGMANPANIGRS